ncbi:MAG: hypothetical protein Q4G08_10885 [Capnocytophaga sp.]|nr:hypothetical protein [Capnocytophaga sp.]
MKKILLAFAVIGLFAAKGQAQSSSFVGFEGDWVVAGQFRYQSVTPDVGDSTAEYTILPIIAYGLQSDVLVGAGLGYTRSDEYNNAFILQPLVRKYWNVANRFYVFGQGSVPINIGKETNNNFASFGVSIAPGLDYVVTDWLTFEVMFDIFNLNYKSVKDGNKTFLFNANPLNGEREFGTMTVGVKFIL